MRSLTKLNPWSLRISSRSFLLPASRYTPPWFSICWRNDRSAPLIRPAPPRWPADPAGRGGPLQATTGAAKTAQIRQRSKAEHTGPKDTGPEASVAPVRHVRLVFLIIRDPICSPALSRSKSQRPGFTSMIGPNASSHNLNPSIRRFSIQGRLPKTFPSEPTDVV